MKKLLVLMAVATAALAVSAGTAFAATPVTVSDGWHEFFWVGGDGAVPSDSPYTFTASGPILVTATDILCKGDRFTLSDGATTLGTTSLVPVEGCPAGGNPGDTSDPDTALADPGYSHGLFALGAGAHSIGIVVSTSPYGIGDGYVRFDPLTTTNCKNGGWATIAASPPFKNQGDCVSFVATGGKNPPG
jgi:hypothetical protein